MNNLKTTNTINSTQESTESISLWNDYEPTVGLSHNLLVRKKIETILFDHLPRERNSKDLLRLIDQLLKAINVKTPESKISRQNDKIAIPVKSGVQLICTNEIIYLEASSNYTTIFLKGTKPILVSKTIKSFEPVLQEPQFVRIHRRHMVNLSEVKAFLRSNGGELLMTNEKYLSISKSNQDRMRVLLKQISAFV